MPFDLSSWILHIHRDVFHASHASTVIPTVVMLGSETAAPALFRSHDVSLRLNQSLLVCVSLFNLGLQLESTLLGLSQISPRLDPHFLMRSHSFPDFVFRFSFSSRSPLAFLLLVEGFFLTPRRSASSDDMGFSFSFAVARQILLR